MSVDYLKELNKEQRAAVEHIEGPMMILAGPGSGKTRTLTYRIAFLMDQGVDPFNILSLTFTNKASREMRERIAKIVGDDARNLWMGTFHSVFARILRIDGGRLGYPSNFTIYDTDDAKSLIKTIVKENGLNEKTYKPNIVLNRISSAKNSLISPKQYAEDPNLTTEDQVSGRPKMAMLYELYTKRCFQAGAMDFDDLLVKMHDLLTKCSDLLLKYQRKFQFIMIDEYQDTNHAQYLITKKLAAQHENICVVGDDAQSIYSFRGADMQNILNFQKDYPDYKLYKLEQNYRSTQSIVNIANEIITKNKTQLPKKIWTSNTEGELIRVVKAMSDNDEGRIVANTIFEAKNRHHLHNRDFAILYRTNAQSRSFEESLRKLNIPYRIYGGISFYQRKEIKDLLAYMKLTVNNKDEEALRRVINYPARGIGKTSMEKLSVIAKEEDKSLWDVMENIMRYPLGARVQQPISEFVTMIKSFGAQLEDKNAYDLALLIARSSGLMKELYADKSVEGLSRYENLQELLNGIKEFVEQEPENNEQPDKSLGFFLQDIMLLTDADNDDDDDNKVKMMTIHAAKGLEFPVVFVVGLEENLFPSMMSMNSREDLEEERRLFYVAVTRAEKFLFLSYAATRYRYGNLIYSEPSRFVDELDKRYIDEQVIHTKQRDMQQKPPEWVSHDRTLRRKVTPQPIKKAPTKTAYKPNPNFKGDNLDDLRAGLEVLHEKFGIGSVLSVDGQGDRRIATIQFKEGQKRIMLKYARMKVREPKVR